MHAEIFSVKVPYPGTSNEVFARAFFSICEPGFQSYYFLILVWAPAVLDRTRVELKKHGM